MPEEAEARARERTFTLGYKLAIFELAFLVTIATTQVAKRRNIDVLLEELERTNASEGKVAEKTATEGSNSHELDANAGESDDANAGESDDAKAGESDDADHSSEEAPSPKDNGENNAEKNVGTCVCNITAMQA